MRDFFKSLILCFFILNYDFIQHCTIIMPADFSTKIMTYIFSKLTYIEIELLANSRVRHSDYEVGKMFDYRLG